MRFVLGNRLLDRAGGTEVHLLTLGLQLRRLGHEVCLYSPELGPFTEHVRGRGLEVVDDTPRAATGVRRGPVTGHAGRL